MARLHTITGLLATFVITVCAQSLNYDLKEMQFSGGDRMLATNDQTNYAIFSKNFPLGWLAASVNGQDVIIVGNDGVTLEKTIGSLTDAERQSLASIKSRFDPVLANNWQWNTNSNFNVRGDDRMQQYGLSKNAFYNRNGGVTYLGNYFSQCTHNHIGDPDKSFSFNEPNGDFTITSSSLPNNWSRVFVEGNLVTTVTKDGNIYTRSWSGLTADEQQQVNSIRGAIYQEVLQSQQEREEARLQREKERQLREQQREQDRLQRERERELRDQQREQDRLQREKERELREQERLQRQRERELRQQQKQQARRQW